MNSIDIAIIAVILISSLLGVGRGFIREVLSLLTWIAALVAARLFSEPVAESLAGVIDNPDIRYIVAFVLIFLGALVVGALLVKLLVKLLTFAGLRLTDRLFGALFGFARGVIIVLVLQFVATGFLADTRAWQESELIPYGETMIEESRLFFDEIYDSGNLNLPVQF